MSCCFGGSRSPKKAKPPTSPVIPPPSPVRLQSAGGTAVVLPGCDPVRLLGEGSFGTVVLVRERSTGVYFAVKIMSKTQLMEEEQLENVITERRVLREAGPHPFVIECHSGFQTADAVVLVLEYLSGGDMYDLLKANGTLSGDEARFYIAEILIGIQELHRFNFVFRDLKLENILLDHAGHVRLTDFGLAGSVESGAWDDRTITDISGTAIYQAPEILDGKGHGRVVDFWALGVLAYVILTGRPPFSSDDRSELNRLIQKTDIDLNKEERLDDLSDDGKDFIRQLLQRDPSKRLGSKDDDGQESIRGHPFMKGIDWDAMLKFDVEPPFPAPLSPPPGLFAEGDTSGAEDPTPRERGASKEAIDAERHVFAKLNRVPSAKAESKGLRKRAGKTSPAVPDLCSEEYKVVNAGAASGADNREGRISIGLDFRGKNAAAKTKTWTGTTNDFGREYAPEKK